MASDRVTFLISGRGLDRIPASLQPGDENPGVGGTHFTSLMRALRLARRHDVDVRVVTDVRELTRLSGVCTEHVISFDDVDASPDETFVAPLTTVTRLNPSWKGRRLIATVHHPHRRTEIAAAAQRVGPIAFASVGQYAYWSNRSTNEFHLWLPNPFPAWALLPTDDLPRTPLRFGFIGTLMHAKGFLDVAECWPQIHRAYPESRLEVIGSSSMYGGVDEQHPDVPAKQGYGDRIVTALGPSRAAVDFFGRVDAGKAAILGRWTVALLNPTGRTEADPSSLKEALAAGAMPVASGDFGMWDLMHRFPRQTISDPRRMARTVIDALADDALSERFRRARTTVLEELLERDAALDDEWVRLLGTSSRQMTGFVPHSQFVPQPPTGIVRRRLIRRRMLSSARTQASAARRILSPIRT